LLHLRFFQLFGALKRLVILLHRFQTNATTPNQGSAHFTRVSARKMPSAERIVDVRGVANEERPSALECLRHPLVHLV
jgi:hypothetical protein